MTKTYLIQTTEYGTLRKAEDSIAAARKWAQRALGVGPRAVSREVTTWDLYWAPEGRKIATVQARTARAAKRKAPQPYRKFLGEIYAVEV